VRKKRHLFATACCNAGKAPFFYTHLFAAAAAAASAAAAAFAAATAAVAVFLSNCQNFLNANLSPIGALHCLDDEITHFSGETIVGSQRNLHFIRIKAANWQQN
jgi:hypothetical protein